MPLNNFTHSYQPTPTPKNENNNNSSNSGKVDNDNKDSVVTLMHNRFHLDETVMIVYDPKRDDLIISARGISNKTEDSKPIINVVTDAYQIDATKDGIYYKINSAEEVDEIYVVRNSDIHKLNFIATPTTPRPDPAGDEHIEAKVEVVYEESVISTSRGNKVYAVVDRDNNKVKKLVAVVAGQKFTQDFTEQSVQPQPPQPQAPESKVFVVENTDQIDRAKDGTYYVKNGEGDITGIYVVTGNQLLTFKPSTINTQRIGTWSI